MRRLCSWLAMVAHDRALNARDKRERELLRSLDTLAAEPMDRDAALRVDAAEWSEWLAAMLARLRREEPDNCWLLCQHWLEERSIQELKEETGWNANEIRCRSYRGMQRMRVWASEFLS